MKDKYVILGLFILLSLSFISSVSAASWGGFIGYIYQENANSTTTDGLGTSMNLGYDGNYSTGSSNGGSFYFNYTMPSNILSAIWQIKTSSFGATYNITIPSYCNYSGSIRLWVNASLAPNGGGQGKCYAQNNTWQSIFNGGGGGTSGKLYEEGMFWYGGNALVTLNSPATNSSPSSNSITTNVTATITGGATLVNMTLYDNSTGTWGARNTTILTGTTNTTTWTNRYTAHGAILWNARVCDSDGTCGFAPANYTFLTDNLAPYQTLNYPTVNNYNYIGQTLQLNWTATDANLSKCWYNYNGTNSTISSCATGVANLANITLTTKKNATFYANDTFGNLNTATLTWDYKVFEEARSYTTPINEVTLTNYTLNLTNNVYTTSVYLVYNGTEYNVPGSAGYYNYQITTPEVSSQKNYSFYWRVLYNNAENITTYTSYQIVNPSVFQLCNTTVNKTFVNFTTNSLTSPYPRVNSTFKASFAYSLSEGGDTKTYTYQDLNSNVSTYAFCSDATSVFYVDGDIEYDATSYALNYYYLSQASLNTSNPTNITLYLQNESLSTITVFKLQDNSQRYLEDYTIAIQKYDIGTGTFYLVAMTTTDFKGEGVAYLNWYDSLYKFLIYDENMDLVKTTPTAKITSSPLTISVGDEVTFDSDKFRDFVYNLSYQGSTGNFVLTYTKPSGEVDNVCLHVVKFEGSYGEQQEVDICNTCQTSSSATLFCYVNGSGNGTYLANFYATGSFWDGDWLYAYIGGTFQETIYGLLDGGDSAFYAFLFAGIVTFSLFINPVIAIVALILGILGASALGFTAIQWGEMLGIIFLGGIIIWLIKR
jgi:hypothetical protein